jgi:ribosome-binding protein aMBF1 (putative translation factor)
MNDSDFWRDLAAEFLSIADSTAVLSADWFREDTQSTWTVRGPLIFQAKFGALARRGAMRLSRRERPDLLEAWLEALRLNGDGFRVLGTAFQISGNEKELTIASNAGTLRNLIEVSASFCKKLESLALQAEYEGRQQSERPAPPLAPVAPKPETIGEQIRRLREESHLSTEELAEKAELDTRTVQRHEAGHMKPQPRRIRTYERTFSKLLKREVVIFKTP